MAFAVAHCFAQTCDFTLQGTIVDIHDDSQLAGATVILVETNAAKLADFDGNFKFSNLCAGTYKLQISHPECSTKVFTVDLRDNKPKVFKLEHHLEELNEILIKGSSYYTKAESILENRISQETIDNNSNASLGDVLKNISGVSSLNTGSTVVKPVINGLHSSRITIINNGVRQQDQEWGAEHAPNIDLNTAGNITVIKGASALQYSGDALGGVIVTEPAPITLRDTIYGKTIATGQTNGRGGSLTSTLTKSYENGWFGRFQGTAKRYGDFEAPDYVLSNTGLSEQDFSINVGVNKIKYGVNVFYSLYKNELGILRASDLGAAEDVVIAINSDVPLIINDFTYDIDAPSQDVTHQLTKLSGFYNWDNLGKLNFTYDLQRNKRLEFDIRRDSEDTRPSVDLRLTTHNLSLSLESDLSDKVSLKTGVVGNYQENFADPATGVRRIIPDYDQYKLAVYGITDVVLSDKWIAEFGARFDYTFMDVFKFYGTSFFEERGYDIEFPEIIIEELGNQVLTNPKLTFNNFSATAGFSHKFSEEYALFANYSLASRAPNPAELFSEGLQQGAARIELGDLRFNSEVAQKTTITFQKKSDRFSFAINGYASFINDFILIEPSDVRTTIRGTFQVAEYRQTNARLLGIDTDVSYKLTDALSVTNKFSFIRGVDTSRDESLIDIPATTINTSIDYTLPIKKEVYIGLESTAVFRQNKFPDNNFEVFLPETQTFESVDVSTPPDAYHLFHFNAGTSFNLGNSSKLNLNLKITNVLDTSYREYLNRLRFYADELGRNILLQVKINY